MSSIRFWIDIPKSNGCYIRSFWAIHRRSFQCFGGIQKSRNQSPALTLREKFPNTEFFLVLIFLYSYSVRIQENADQKKLRIWTLLTQCKCKDLLMPQENINRYVFASLRACL